MKRIAFISLVLTLIVGITSIGRAEMQNKPLGQSGHKQSVSKDHLQKVVEMLKEKLNLDKEQAKKINEIAISHHKKMIEIKDSAKVAKIELAKLIMKPDATDEEVDGQLNKFLELSSEIEKNHIQFILDIKKVLTTEQLEKLAGMKPFESIKMDKEEPESEPEPEPAPEE